ncbi:non-ribosomal peptide synthetase, partial [Thermoflavimicrobium dichotomicum]
MLVGQRGQIEDVYPMSDIQLGMVYYSAKNPELAIYHDQIVYELEDDSFNVNLLQKALGLLVSKHEILRTSFHIDEFSVPAQIVWDEVPVRVEEIDISAYSAEEQRVRIRQYLLEDRSQPFDVKSAPLWRMKVFRLRAHQVALAWIFHHAILDGWSVASFISELIDVYFRLKQGPVHVKPLRTKYKDYVVEQMAISEQPEMAAFWQKELQGYKRLQLSVSLSSNQPVTCLIEELDSHLVKELKKVAQANQTTLRALSLAAFLSMLYMISYENDLTVGLVENARPLAEDADRMLGCFLNSVPFRMTIANGMTWKELIQQVHQKQIQMKTYGRFPLMKIVEAIGETRVDENPIFDVLFNYVDFHVLERVKDHSLKISQESYERTNTLLDFSVSATFNHLGIRVTSMLPKEEMRKLLAYYKRALQAFIHHLNEKIDKISLLSEKERHQLLIEFNNTDVDYPRDKTIQQLFEEQVEKTPEQVALIYQGESITYQQLNKMSNQLARALKKKGVQREQIVGIISERSFDMIVGLLGILKAGGAYMPIDPTYPADRIEYMLEDSGIRLLIVQKEEMIPAYYQGEVVLLSDPQWQEESGTNLEIENTASDLAYIIYTSGSTGKPKGILTTHRNVVRTIKNNGYIEITEDDRILQLSNYAFDGSTFDIYSALLNGAQLVLVSKEELLDPRKLAKLIVQYQITVTFMTTALFNTLVHLDVDCFKHMRKILFGGEKVSIKHVQQALAYLGEHKIIHVYGPTETTVFATAFSVDRSILESQTVPIGKPISNTTCYVVNRDGQLQPIGIPGELCIGGEGLARGYLNRPDLTDERFVENPFVPGEWMYKTGDFVRMLPDGNIEYLERLDDQVKIRGFRIELGEITDQLLQHPQIEEAVVVARTDEQGHSYLCAYLVTDGPWTVAELREHLGKSLPEYMIPSYFVELEKLPLNANGKVDKRALPELCADLMSEGYVAPTNATEESLVQIWKDVLKVEQ